VLRYLDVKFRRCYKIFDEDNKYSEQKYKEIFKKSLQYMLTERNLNHKNVRTIEPLPVLIFCLNQQNFNRTLDKLPSPKKNIKCKN
jgi:hypothetical protein